MNVIMVYSILIIFLIHLLFCIEFSLYQLLSSIYAGSMFYNLPSKL